VVQHCQTTTLIMTFVGHKSPWTKFLFFIIATAFPRQLVQNFTSDGTVCLLCLNLYRLVHRKYTFSIRLHFCFSSTDDAHASEDSTSDSKENVNSHTDLISLFYYCL